MRTKILSLVLLLLLIVCAAVPVFAAEVTQGKCTAYDNEKKQLTIEEYNTKFSKEHRYGEPTGQQASFDTSKALIGIPPAPGDVIRIAYNRKGDMKEAVRIMNVSKQDLRKK
ncbi:MAG: hypothetical protein V1792_26260 [Pseudomonadota bacterium]